MRSLEMNFWRVAFQVSTSYSRLGSSYDTCQKTVRILINVLKKSIRP